MNNSVIIIGAGAAGLMAARELSANKQSVTILEANNRIGGRIHTLSNQSFLKPVELGAEFIHGNLPTTNQLLKEANVRVTRLGGEMMHVENGRPKKENEFGAKWDELMKRMEKLEQDMTVADFLEKYFSDEEAASLRSSVKGFAEGFDLANISSASVFALRREWEHEEEKQYKVEGGYQQLIDHLFNFCVSNGCTVHTSCIAKEIHWKKNEVKVVTKDNRSFKCSKVVITVPIGVLQAELNQEASITFSPSIYDFFQAAKLVGYGTVIKILFQFNELFWNKKTGFILSNETIPTWWTQSPQDYPLLTGWLNGSKAKTLPKTDENTLFGESLHSLSSIFDIEEAALKEKLTAWKIIDWSSESFALGGYSFDKLETVSGRKILNLPIQETIFFAGEALYNGNAPGTVEAALVSGREAAEKVMAS